MFLLWLCIVTVIHGIPSVDGRIKSAFDNIASVNRKFTNKHIKRYGKGVFLEGDIAKSPRTLEFIEKMKAGDFSAATYDAINRGQWPNAIVPYTLHSSLSSTARSAIYAAIADYKKYTCIKFVPYTRAAASSAGGYVEFFVGGGCYSMIGRQGNKQRISIGNGCQYKGTVIHEMMHALGFFHEQSRRDRDSFIFIYKRNISPRTQYNFDMYRQGEASTLGEPYDKKSVMHYGNYAFSINRQPTIVSKANRNEKLGNTQLSPIDIRQLNKYYSCSTTTTKKTCSDSLKGCTFVKAWCGYVAIKTDCKKTCGACGTTVKPVKCVDKDTSGHCPAWARDRKRYCTTNRYVRDNCKNSCKTC